MKLRERVLWSVVAVLGIILFLYCIPATPSVCEPPDKDGKEHCTPYRIPAFLFIESTKTLNDYGAAITAMATVAIAWFTIQLSRSTRAQAILTRDAIELGTKEYVATHRPKVAIRLITISAIVPNEFLTVKLHIFNVGDSSAFIEAYNASIITRQGGETLYGLPAYKNKSTQVDGIEIKSGGYYKIEVLSDSAINREGVVDVSSYTRVLCVYGHIRYRDSNRVIRRAGFLRRYDHANRRFITVSDPDYEYAD